MVGTGRIKARPAVRHRGTTKGCAVEKSTHSAAAMPNGHGQQRIWNPPLQCTVSKSKTRLLPPPPSHLGQS